MVTEQEAIARARQTAQAEGWAWVEPAQATLHRAWTGGGGRWVVFSNSEGLGAKARVIIDARTGNVLEKGYVPR
jgi:hypothetical protein